MQKKAVVVENENQLFNRIAPVYGLFFNFQVRYYEKVITKLKPLFDIAAYESILDVGCGTGALCQVLFQKGLRVTGIDAASGMVKLSRKKTNNKKITFLHGGASGLLPFQDKAFDIAISAYVAHGMKRQDRYRFYREMSRVAKRYVIFHDYNDNRSLSVNLVEWLEGGDYFNFIKNAKKEMEENFDATRIINVNPRAAWYICTPFC